MTQLKDTYTSTGAKFFYHEEAMRKLRNGQGMPITTHVMLTDVCNHKCAFCSVQHREGDSLRLEEVFLYLATLKQYGLKSVILSGGGNPILYRDKVTGQTFNDAVTGIHSMGLQIGLITNGMPMKVWPWAEDLDADWHTPDHVLTRESWRLVKPGTLDKLTWVRISMSGLDHEEDEVFVPDIDPSKTTLGFSYVLHDIYKTCADKKHGAVSTREDLDRLGVEPDAVITADERIPKLTEQIRHYVEVYKPRYVRLLPNCLEPGKIDQRVGVLQHMADAINPEVVFVQHKPPAAPNQCFLGYVHPVLNADGFVYPCDSCVLNEKAGHQFNQSWRICHWSQIASLYNNPVRSLIKDPKKQCPGCVFTQSCNTLEGVVLGTVAITPPDQTPEHANFI